MEKSNKKDQGRHERSAHPSVPAPPSVQQVYLIPACFKDRDYSWRFISF
jgi:hypothetical protein